MLSYLRRFSSDKLKIDQSFVLDMADDAGRMAIVRWVAGLGITLGMTTTAEGIETAEQLTLVKTMGCNEGQGYLFGRPMPAAELLRELGLATGRAAA